MAAAPPTLFDEARDLLVFACATHFLGRMRLVAREEKEDAESDDASSNNNKRAFPAATAATLLATPIAPRQIAAAIDARAEGAVPFLDDEADFGRGRWADVNARMLRDPPPSWEIVEFGDERSDKELVYAIAIDDVKQRAIVGFRASVTSKDWRVNLNMVYGPKTNPLCGMELGEAGAAIEQPKKLVMHRGFRDYLFQKEGGEVGDSDDEDSDEDDTFPCSSDCKTTTKIQSILQNVAKVLDERPGYSLYTTGYSLGAALATIFAFYAAASDDPRLPTPVTCVTVGSPKCGTLSFRKGFAALEAAGKLRCLRLVNEYDPIKEAPLKSLDSRMALVTGSDYRHVGVALHLGRDGSGEGTASYGFSYPKVSPSYRRLVQDDWHRQRVLCRDGCLVCWDHLRCRAAPSEIGDHHGYAEYLHRLEANREGLQKRDLDELYREAREGSVPRPCAFPWCCPPSEPVGGELRLHYY